MSSQAAGLLRSARQGAGISQRELARRAATAQSVVARIERGTTSPSWNTLDQLVRAAGYELSAEVISRAPPDASILDDVPRILTLSPEDRLREVGEVSRFVVAARRV